MPNQIAIRRPFRKRGQNPWFYSRSLNKGSATGSGGIEFGGAATVAFVHAGSVASDIVVQWDFDNDTDFSESVEDITAYVTQVETFTGRDWPSLLTGRAGPGKFKATLDNSDNRFNYFNAASPLVTAPFSLKTGRKLRVKTSDAGNPDPTRLAKDRFRRATGALGSEEFGLTYVEPLADDFTISSNRAVAVTEAAEHIAVVNVSVDDYYVQTKVSVIGDLNTAGVVYRYVDSNDYSLCVINATTNQIQLIDVVSGTPTTVSSTSVEVYGGVTVGALVSDSSVIAYLEGVAMLSATAINTTATSVGFYAKWITDDARPEIDEFFSWSSIPTSEEGVLWTGDVSDLESSVSAGPRKFASVSGDGWLSKLSSQEITPPASATGRRTGLLLGSAIAKALQIHPPMLIDLGDVFTGAFAMDERSALAVARDVEEVEFGFLYETQEGYLSFRDRSHRDGVVSSVTFTDDPSGQFHYHAIQPYDWKKEVFNRVLAGVSPWTQGVEAVLFTDPGPYTLASGETQQISASYDGVVVQWTGHTRDITPASADPSGISVITKFDNDPNATYGVLMPATVTVGDLLMIIIQDTGLSWDGTPPAGWTLITDLSLDLFSVLVKVADGTEDGTTVNFTGTNLNASWASQVYRVTGWYGSLSGVEITSEDSGTSTTPNPPEITPSWGSLPTLFIPVLSLYTSATGVSINSYPSGYSSGTYVASNDGTLDTGIGSAQKIATATSENPGTYTISSSKLWHSNTIAIRGPGSLTPVTDTTPSGSDPVFTIAYDVVLGGTTQSHTNIQVTGIPLIEGDQTFAQADDYDSQDDHNSIRTYQASATLFASPTDAATYAALVLAKYADDRPILSMSFYATRSPAYRAQAARRRVGDKITLIADNNTGFGISADFFIESINHRWSNGNTLWETTWELSPA